MSTTPGGKRQLLVERCRIILEQFFEANPDLTSAPDPSLPAPPLGNPGRMLARASQTNDPCAFSLILQAYLIKAGLKPPKGVFKLDLNIGVVGRPRKFVEEVEVYLSRHRTKRPKSFGEVAREVFPQEYSKEPKAAADRARQLYRSFEALLPALASGERKLEIVSSRE